MTNLLAIRLSESRKRLGEMRGVKVTVQEAAEAVGIGRSTLSVYENGHDSPGLQTLIALADFYHVSLDFLTGRASTQCGTSDHVAKDDDERSLLDAWRDISEEDRAALRVGLRNARIAADRSAA